MTDNPLMNARPQGTRDLDQYAHWLNGLNFVAMSGSPYFVAERDTPNGGMERYLGRGA